MIESIAISENLDDYCVDEQVISPLYHQLRPQLEQVPHWFSKESNLPSKIYSGESSKDRFIRGLENSVSSIVTSIEYDHSNSTSCGKTIFLSSINKGFVYALVIDRDSLVNRNSKVVVFKGFGSAYLFNFNDCNAKCEYVVTKKVASFVPPE